MVAVVLLFWSLSCSTGRRPPTSADADLSLDATELVAAFERNETQAAELYLGKTALISGYFVKAERGDSGNYVITFKTSIETFRPVRCILGADDPATPGRFQRGDPLTVVGRITGFSDSKYFVTVDECSVR